MNISPFVLALVAAAAILFWHIFFVMQITPQVADFLANETGQSDEFQPTADLDEDGEAARRHYRMAITMIDQLNENFDEHSAQDKYRLAFLTKEHLKVVYRYVEGTGTETEQEIKEMREKIQVFLQLL